MRILVKILANPRLNLYTRTRSRKPSLAKKAITKEKEKEKKEISDCYNILNICL
jgi:hypothetical protein